MKMSILIVVLMFALSLNMSGVSYQPVKFGDRPVLVPPTVNRPEPRIITVNGADWATMIPWSPAIVGLHLNNGGASAWGDELVYLVDPDIEYMVITHQLGHLSWISDFEQHRANPTVYEFDVPITYENRLDWILYNKAMWKIQEIEFIAEYGMTPEQLMDSIARVEYMMNNEPSAD